MMAAAAAAAAAGKEIPEPVLLAVLALLVPKEKELASVAVAAPKAPPAVFAVLEAAPKAGWPKEKPLAGSLLPAG
ncbi:hypothetical protein EYF80_006554 [Liparis tanakae]|uniref:Uncharacterized protein n=1 Tax=Liparis tanakae TaxID=230148 RepID=A0A4Z2IZU4_9TELE|nr:hypothetical protein EYF80_006554 [Liparis tanakae]